MPEKPPMPPKKRGELIRLDPIREKRELQRRIAVDTKLEKARQTIIKRGQYFDSNFVSDKESNALAGPRTVTVAIRKKHSRFDLDSPRREIQIVQLPNAVKMVYRSGGRRDITIQAQIKKDKTFKKHSGTVERSIKDSRDAHRIFQKCVDDALEHLNNISELWYWRRPFRKD